MIIIRLKSGDVLGWINSNRVVFNRLEFAVSEVAAEGTALVGKIQAASCALNMH